MGIASLAKGAWKNIGKASATPGVWAAAGRRTAIGAGIGFAGGGIIGAANGEGFFEGGLRGATTGAIVGAGSAIYKAGAFGANALDDAGRFRSGANKQYGSMFRLDDNVNVAKKSIKDANKAMKETQFKVEQNGQIAIDFDKVGTISRKTGKPSFKVEQNGQIAMDFA